ncbi:hypothetical protein CYMTET_33309 [Cymbomonas tetramitiformis]|uniref:Uncharacterized protein n=1 Tax=Cymbomonas tetramitiformis TaxID=36881 RepID=A0AAE0FE01_9CHLO|nr:hypothetical protein CYMTET_33309 [Cymbomonas tetramitiformis]
MASADIQCENFTHCLLEENEGPSLDADSANGKTSEALNPENPALKPIPANEPPQVDTRNDEDHLFQKDPAPPKRKANFAANPKAPKAPQAPKAPTAPKKQTPHPPAKGG